MKDVKPKKIHRGMWLLISLLVAWCLMLAVGVFVFESENNYIKVGILVATMSLFVGGWIASLCCRRS